MGKVMRFSKAVSNDRSTAEQLDSFCALEVKEFPPFFVGIFVYLLLFFHSFILFHFHC